MPRAGRGEVQSGGRGEGRGRGMDESTKCSHMWLMLQPAIGHHGQQTHGTTHFLQYGPSGVSGPALPASPPSIKGLRL